MCVFDGKGIFQCFGFNYYNLNKDERKGFGRDTIVLDKNEVGF
jgi:hypothetical protein